MKPDHLDLQDLKAPQDLLVLLVFKVYLGNPESLVRGERRVKMDFQGWTASRDRRVLRVRRDLQERRDTPAPPVSLVKLDFQENPESRGNLVFRVKMVLMDFLETTEPRDLEGNVERTASPGNLDPRVTTDLRDQEEVQERGGSQVLQDSPVQTELGGTEASRARGDRRGPWAPKERRVTRGKLDPEDNLELQGMSLMLSLSLESPGPRERKERRGIKENQENWVPGVYLVSKGSRVNQDLQVRRATPASRERRGEWATLAPPASPAPRGPADYRAMWASRGSSGLLDPRDREEKRVKRVNPDRPDLKVQPEIPERVARPDHQGGAKMDKAENQDHRESRDPRVQRAYRDLKENQVYRGTGAIRAKAKWDHRVFQEKLVNLVQRV